MITTRNTFVCSTGLIIGYITMECGKKRIEKIIDPERDGACRVTSNCFLFLEEDEETGPMPNGIIIFGTFKWNRFTPSEVLSEYPEYKQEIDELRNKSGVMAGI